MVKKNYNGYTSFQYLNLNEDYPRFTLARQVNRVPTYNIPLAEAEQNRLDRILDDTTVISLRDHGMILPRDSSLIVDYCRQPFTVYAYMGLSVSGLDAFFDDFMGSTALISSYVGWKWTDVKTNLGMRYADIAHQQMLVIAQRTRDIVHASEAGQIAVIPCMEAATPIENELDRIDVLYGLGVRCMGITYNEANSLGSGVGELQDAGLTSFGTKVVKRMNQLGMAIDISHCGDRTSLDVIRASDSPVLLTHAGAKALWNTPRMKSDAVLRACAERGGVIGIMASPNTTMTQHHSVHTLEAVMEHFQYIVDLVGIDHVGFGPDTMFGDHVALQHAFDTRLSLSKTHSGEEFNESDYVVGLENPTQTTRNIIAWLISHGYTDSHISKVVGGNVLHVLDEIWT